MGWISDIIDDIGDWLYDTFIEPFTKWVKQAIEDVVTWFRVMRHDFNKLLAQWLDNDWFFVSFVAAIVVLIVLAPRVAAAIKNSTIYKVLTNTVNLIVDKVIGVFDVSAVINLKLINDVLNALWDDYRELNASLSRAVSALAGELGEGSGYIHAYFAAARGLIYSTSAIAGLPPKSAEMEWYDKSTAFFKKLDDRFSRYARNPGLVVTDFIDDVLIPAATEQGDLNRAQVEEINKRWERTLEVENGLKLFRDSVNSFIANLPAEIEAKFTDRWEPINEALNETFLYFDNEMKQRFQEVIDSLNEAEHRQERLNRIYTDKMKALAALLTAPETLDADDWRAMADRMQEYVLTDGTEATEADNKNDTLLRDKLRQLYDQLVESAPKEGPLSYEPESKGFSLTGKKMDIPSPFVGDY